MGQEHCHASQKHFAKQKGTSPLGRLLEARASPDLANDAGNCPLHWVPWSPHILLTSYGKLPAVFGEPRPA